MTKLCDKDDQNALQNMFSHLTYHISHYIFNNNISLMFDVSEKISFRHFSVLIRNLRSSVYRIWYIVLQVSSVKQSNTSTSLLYTVLYII